MILHLNQFGNKFKPLSDDSDNKYTLFAGLSRPLSSIKSSLIES